MGNSPFNDMAGTRREIVTPGYIAAATGTFSVTLLNPDADVTIETVEVLMGIAVTGNDAARKNINIQTGTNADPTVVTEVANRDYNAAGGNPVLGDRETVWTPTGTDGDINAEGYLLAEIELVGGGLIIAPSFVVSYRIRE